VGDSKLSGKTLKLLGDDSDAHAGKYNSKVAALCASVAGWSYANIEDFHRILSDNSQINLTEADFVEVSATNDSMLIVATAQIIRTSDRRSAIVCFRGTEPTNAVNWATDLNANKVPYLDQDKNIKVHQGFLSNFQAVWNGWEGVLSYLKNPAKMSEDYEEKGSLGDDKPLENIYITGHSLGGAMAFLAGLYLSFANDRQRDELWDKVRGIYTYGQPMVIDNWSDNECHRLIGDRLFRHVYYNDVVPHAPSISMGLFAHIGHEYRWHPRDGWTKTSKGKTVTQVPFATMCLPGIAWDTVGSSVILPFSLFKSPWSIIDHLPTGYINTLNGLGGGDVRGLKTLGGLLANKEDKVVDEMPRIVKPEKTGSVTEE